MDSVDNFLGSWKPIAIVVIGFFMLALMPDRTAPHWDNVCVKEVTDMISVPSGETTMLIPTSTCMKYEIQCVVGEDFAGNKSCTGPKPARID